MSRYQVYIQLEFYFLAPKLFLDNPQPPFTSIPSEKSVIWPIPPLLKHGTWAS
jgi:hypothetical protein